MRMHNPPHVGEIISGILDELDLGIRDLAKALAIAPSTASRLVSGSAAVTPEMAIKLSAVLGSTPEMWMRLQTTYSLEKAEKYVDVSMLHPVFKPAPINADAL